VLLPCSTFRGITYSQQELSTANDRITVVTAIANHTEGLAIHGYDAFTANKKDTRKVTAGRSKRQKSSKKKEVLISKKMKS